MNYTFYQVIHSLCESLLVGGGSVAPSPNGPRQSHRNQGCGKTPDTGPQTSLLLAQLTAHWRLIICTISPWEAKHRGPHKHGQQPDPASGLVFLQGWLKLLSLLAGRRSIGYVFPLPQGRHRARLGETTVGTASAPRGHHREASPRRLTHHGNGANLIP